MNANETAGEPMVLPVRTGLDEVDRAIATKYARLSTGQRRAIDHLLADARYGAVISASQLAIAVGVSESTITRAAQTLGFAGFPDLQRHLRERFVAPVQERLEPLERDTAQPVSIAARVMVKLGDQSR